MIPPEHSWKVVPLSRGQMFDVRAEDVLENGLYRRCKTYRGGGGYDRFPAICEKRLGISNADVQFIVQLQGCNLDCPYCYVTREGVWGEPVRKSTSDLVEAYLNAGAPVFHLMGGAPALQITRWSELLDLLEKAAPYAVFHSDLLLTERPYSSKILQAISYRRQALYAIDIKGLTDNEWRKNTRKEPDWPLFWSNLQRLCDSADLSRFYLTYTACSREAVFNFESYELPSKIKGGEKLCKDSYSIDLIEYDALPYVDDRPWGANN